MLHGTQWVDDANSFLVSQCPQDTQRGQQGAVKYLLQVYVFYGSQSLLGCGAGATASATAQQAQQYTQRHVDQVAIPWSQDQYTSLWVLVCPSPVV